MSNLYSYFVNPKTVSYITSEYVDVNNIDSSNIRICSVFNCILELRVAIIS